MTDTDESVPVRERLARAVCAVYWPNHPWDEAAEWQHDRSFEAVDAILTELQEPSEGMKSAGFKALMAADDQDKEPIGACHFAIIQHIRNGGR